MYRKIHYFLFRNICLRCRKCPGPSQLHTFCDSEELTLQALRPVSTIFITFIIIPLSLVLVLSLSLSFASLFYSSLFVLFSFCFCFCFVLFVFVIVLLCFAFVFFNHFKFRNNSALRKGKHDISGSNSKIQKDHLFKHKP